MCQRGEHLESSYLEVFKIEKLLRRLEFRFYLLDVANLLPWGAEDFQRLLMDFRWRPVVEIIRECFKYVSGDQWTLRPRQGASGRLLHVWLCHRSLQRERVASPSGQCWNWFRVVCPYLSVGNFCTLFPVVKLKNVILRLSEFSTNFSGAPLQAVNVQS